MDDDEFEDEEEFTVYDAMVGLVAAGKLPVFIPGDEPGDFLVRYYNVASWSPVLVGDELVRERLVIDVILCTGADVPR